MTNNAQPNPLEMLAFVVANEIKDKQIVYVGTGLPMVGAILAKKTHAPNITLVYESGGQDPIEGPMPWSVADPVTWRKAPLTMEMSLSFAQAANGYVDVAFQGAAQIDMYGNLNTHVIGDFLQPKARLTGSGGGNDLSSLTENSIIVGLQTPEKFPAKLDFLTSPGHLTGGNARKEAGLLGNGPVAVITQVGVYDFEPETKRMRIKSLHPGMTVEIAQACTGFELLVPEGEIPVTATPSAETLRLLREEVDPQKMFITFPPQ